MIVSDGVYYRIPKFWLIIGILFLLLALVGGSDFRFFYACLLLSVLCIARSFQIHQNRRKLSRRNRVTLLTDTQKIERGVP
jgi:hypothetical protein